MIENVLHYWIYKMDKGILGEKNAESKGDRETISFQISFQTVTYLLISLRTSYNNILALYLLNMGHKFVYKVKMRLGPFETYASCDMYLYTYVL